MSLTIRRRVVHVAGVILRGRYLLLAVCAGVSFAPQYLIFSDYDLFSYGGQALLGHVAGYHAGLHIYVDHPELQIGPGPLALAGLLPRLLPYDVGHYAWIGMTLAFGLGTVRALELTARHLGYDRRRAAWISLVGGACLLASWSELAVWGHLEEAATICLMFMAVAAVAARRPWWAPALLIGIAAMCKAWGIVELPLLLVLPRRYWTRAAVVTLGVLAVSWLPFMIAAPNSLSALGSIPSTVFPNSALRLFGLSAGHGGPTSARSFELLLGLSMGTLTVLRRRWLALPLVGLSARALLDPRWFIYYGVGLLAAAMLWDIVERRRFPLWTVTVGLLEFVAQLWLPAEVGAAAQVVMVVAIAAGVTVSARRAGSSLESDCGACGQLSCLCSVTETPALTAA